MKKLTVVIVSYNVRYYIEQCIISVERATEGIDREICVVDNDSHDDTVDYLKERFADRITLIESQHNLGFARANNIAIRQTQSEYVLLLNPDTFVTEESIRKVLTFMDEHPKAGGAGVRMYNADGTVARESRRGLPTPWVSLLKMLGFSKRYYMSHLSWDEPGQIEVMSGAFCMLRREALDKVGLLDEDFFMYGEDIDLSYRILKGGYENWYVPANILHYKGESTHKSSYRYVHVFYDAMLIFFRKHYGHMSFLVTLPIKVAIYLRAFIALCQMLHWRLWESLGFDKGERPVEYVFVGGPEMIEECRKLARRRGLSATFLGANASERLNSGEIGANASERLNSGVPTLGGVGSYTVQAGQAVTIVYDTIKLSFAEILSDAAHYSPNTIQIGTYSTQSHILITPQEIVT